MARPLRIELAGGLYHVTSRGDRREEIFHCDREMLGSARARLLAYYDSDKDGSLAVIEETIGEFPDQNYPILTKAELAIHFRDKEKLKAAIEKLEHVTGKNAQSYRTFIRFKALYLAMTGDLDGAKVMVNKELKGLIPSSLQRLQERLEQLASPASNSK